jgi:hypothetical protein
MRKSVKETIEDMIISTSALMSEGALQAAPVISLCASDMIAMLKERLLRLHPLVENRRQLFRLSYSILTLEACLEEKNIAQIAIERSPGIQTILKRIEAEIDALCRQEGVAPRATKDGVATAVDDASDAMIGRLFDTVDRLSHQLEQMSGQIASLTEESDVLRLLSDLQKHIQADGRRNYASQAALHASIERLSDRLEQIEGRMSRQIEASAADSFHQSRASDTARERDPIDPRPMLMAARAAAARALMDIEPKSGIVANPSPPKPAPLSEPPLPRRRWGFAFAAA